MLQTPAELLGGRAQVELMPLRDVPLYNADLDGDALPDPVRRLKQADAADDALVLYSPECHYGMPGVLKNAID